MRLNHSLNEVLNSVEQQWECYALLNHNTFNQWKCDGHFNCRIASLSKIFPTLMLYKLWEDGLVDSLDDPLEKYTNNFTIKNPLRKSSRPASSSARRVSSRSPELTLRRMASQLSGKYTVNLNDMAAIFDSSIAKGRTL